MLVGTPNCQGSFLNSRKLANCAFDYDIHNGLIANYESSPDIRRAQACASSRKSGSSYVERGPRKGEGCDCQSHLGRGDKETGKKSTRRLHARARVGGRIMLDGTWCRMNPVYFFDNEFILIFTRTLTICLRGNTRLVPFHACISDPQTMEAQRYNCSKVGK